MTRVLITGGSGFIGRQICTALTDKGLKLRAVVRPFSNQVNSAGETELCLSEDIFSEDLDWWRDALSSVDVVIHAAWYTNPKDYLHSQENIKCLTGSLTLLQAVRESRVSAFVGLGTCLEYDTSLKYLSTRSREKPDSLYANSKLSLLYIGRKLLQERNIKLAWCRIFNLYGEGEKADRLIPYVRKCLSNGEVAKLSNGNQIRDYLDVKEAGSMIADVAANGFSGIHNICSGKPVSIKSLVTKVATEFGREDLLEFDNEKNVPKHEHTIVGVL